MTFIVFSNFEGNLDSKIISPSKLVEELKSRGVDAVIDDKDSCSKKYYEGAFMNPSFLFHDEDPYFDKFWNEVGCILNFVGQIIFPYKGFNIPVNIHKMSFISIEHKILENVKDTSGFSGNIKELAFRILSSFVGMFNFYYLSKNEDEVFLLPIETFYYDGEMNHPRFKRYRASERFMYASFHEIVLIPQWRERTILGSGYHRENIVSFIERIYELIEKKKLLSLDDEFYILISRIVKYTNDYNQEGIIITGWTVCEYLRDKLCELYGVNKKQNTKKIIEELNIEQEYQEKFSYFIKIRNNVVHNPMSDAAMELITKNPSHLANGLRELYDYCIKLLYQGKSQIGSD